MGIFSKKKADAPKARPAAKPAAAAVVKKGDEAKPSMKDLYADGTSPTGVAKDAKAEKKEWKFGAAYRVIIKPLITEKAANVGTLNKYVFAVRKNTNKIEVGKAIQEIYGIKPANVNIINVMGKKVRYGRVNGVRSDWKKAIITLPAGKTINIYEGV